jgi:intracellular multiplication protein IcmT
MSRQTTWRYCGVQPLVPLLPGFGVSPYAFLPLLLWLFHWSWSMAYLAIGTMLACIVMAKFGFTMKRLVAFIQHRLRGKRIHARPWWYRKRFSPAGHRVGSLRSGICYDDERKDEPA